MIHHGAFYQASLSLELDGTTLALALTAPITHSRIRMLNDPDTNGGNAFLAADADGSSGLMMVEYVAAGAIAEIRNAAQPASAGTLVLSRGAEEDATFASQGAQQLERSIAAYRVLLCCELVGAVRLLRQRGLDDQFTGVVGDALALAAVLPRNDEDRDLRGDIALAESLLDDIGRLVERIPQGIMGLLYGSIALAGRHFAGEEYRGGVAGESVGRRSWCGVACRGRACCVNSPTRPGCRRR